MKDCQHLTTELRIWLLKNGVRQVVHQCMGCGETVGGSLKHSLFTPEQRAAMPLLDIALRDRYREQRRRLYQQAALERQQQFEKGRIELTEKYHAYLQSPEWRAKRLKVLQRDNFICQGCLTEPATQVHHTTYEHIFDEQLFELVSICDCCHKRAHKDRQK